MNNKKRYLKNIEKLKINCFLKDRNLKIFYFFINILIIFFMVSFNSSKGVPLIKDGSILIPAYFYPLEEEFQKLLYIKNSFKQIIILNVEDGPSFSFDENYEQAIKKLINIDKIPIGYVYTSYGERDVEIVKRDIDLWFKFYPNLKGIFLDEVNDTEETKDYYKTLYEYIKFKFNGLVVLNPGTNFAKELINYCDYAVIFEDSLDKLPKFEIEDELFYHIKKLVILVYGVNNENFISVFSNIISKGIKNFYITNDDLPNPWDNLSDFLYLLQEP